MARAWFAAARDVFVTDLCHISASRSKLNCLNALRHDAATLLFLTGLSYAL